MVQQFSTSVFSGETNTTDFSAEMLTQDRSDDDQSPSVPAHGKSTPFVVVANPEQVKTPLCDNHPFYATRIQSHRFHDDNSIIPSRDLYNLLERDLDRRVITVNSYIADTLFPDRAFGFPITASFVMNFTSAFVSPDASLNKANFSSETATTTFLNRIITTIAQFLKQSGQSKLRPLRYFTSVHSQKPLPGNSPLKPDIMVVRLIDGCTQDISLAWPDVQAFAEHTSEKLPPKRMQETVTLKSYQMFCSQPERDFVICLCIMGGGFYIVVTTHAAQFETDVMGFGPNANIPFFRMVMGLAFLSDEMIGIDSTMFRRCDATLSSGKKLGDLYKPFSLTAQIEPITFRTSIEPPTLAVVYTPAEEGFDKNFSHIMVGDQRYNVIRLLFRAQTLIGRATRTFLVELPDGTEGILKDSWGIVDRSSEAAFIQGLEIPFGPSLIDSCSLRTTGIFQNCILSDLLKIIDERRVKRRLVTSPAGVHISNFSSLWELMVAFLDVIIGMTVP
jgi:hypothetical protein